MLPTVTGPWIRLEVGAGVCSRRKGVQNPSPHCLGSEYCDMAVDSYRT